MSGFSGISKIAREFVSAAAERASAALSSLLVVPDAIPTISEDTYAQHCGPSRTALIQDPALIACRGRVFDATLLGMAPENSFARHWNRMVMSAISALDATHNTMAINTPFQLIPSESAGKTMLLPPVSNHNRGSITLVPYYPPAANDHSKVLDI